MSNFILHLNEQPFTRMKNLEKNIEMRLYDEKRRQMKVGDNITFILQGDESQKLNCEILNILVYDNFDELYNDYDKLELGYTQDEEARPSDMEAFYPKEEQDKYGVVAIEIEVL